MNEYRVCPMHLYKVELTVHRCLHLWCRQFNELMIKSYKVSVISISKENLIAFFVNM